MKTYFAGWHQTQTKPLSDASTWIHPDKPLSLNQTNYQLINQLNDTECQKHFYRNKLNNEYRVHQAELQQAFKEISLKNEKIVNLEEELDQCNKECRTLIDELQLCRKNSESDKEYFDKELQLEKTKCEEKVRALEEKFEIELYQKVTQRAEEIQNQCRNRIKLFESQIETLTQTQKNLASELKMAQQHHQQFLLENDKIVQETINRELQKREGNSQKVVARDETGFEELRNQRKALQNQLAEADKTIEELKSDNRKLKASLQVQKTKVSDLQETLKSQIDKNRVDLSEKYTDTEDKSFNTEQPYVPVVMPIDLDLMGQVLKCKQYLVQKIMQRFLTFFSSITLRQPKRKSHSLIIFKNELGELRTGNPQIGILLLLHTQLDKVIKVYCPAMIYSREFLTAKDQLVKKTLMECQAIENYPQKLYRLLELVYRLRYPVNNHKEHISNGQLRLLEIKVLMALKRVFK